MHVVAYKVVLMPFKFKPVIRALNGMDISLLGNLKQVVTEGVNEILFYFNSHLFIFQIPT